MASYTELHQHNELYNFIMDQWCQTQEIVIYRWFKSGYAKWLRLRTTIGHASCKSSEFFLYQKDHPSPQIPARVQSCTSDRLVIKGKMIYHRPNKPVSFKLKFKKGKKSSVEEYRGVLSISGYEDIDVALLRSALTSPEWTMCKIPHGTALVPLDSPVWWSNHFTGNFRGWVSGKEGMLKLACKGVTYHLDADACLAIFSKRPAVRCLQIDQDSIEDG